MKKEYSLVIVKIDGEHIWQLRKGDVIIDSLSWEEAEEHRPTGVYLLQKHNISFEAAGYSCNQF